MSMEQQISKKDTEIADLAKIPIEKSRPNEEIVQYVLKNLTYDIELQELTSIIKRLIDTKYIVPGYALTKAEVLDNNKRKDIMLYISKNPGIHGRAIRDYLKLGANEYFWHISILEKFELIKTITFENNNGLFLNRSFQDYEIPLIFFQMNKTQTILKQCEKTALSMLQITKSTKMHYYTVKKYVNALLENDMLIKIEEEGKEKYRANIDFILKLKKIINSSFFDDFM